LALFSAAIISDFYAFWPLAGQAEFLKVEIADF
jgi:hypothetical protein